MTFSNQSARADCQNLSNWRPEPQSRRWRDGDSRPLIRPGLPAGQTGRTASPQGAAVSPRRDRHGRPNNHGRRARRGRETRSGEGVRARGQKQRNHGAQAVGLAAGLSFHRPALCSGTGRGGAGRDPCRPSASRQARHPPGTARGAAEVPGRISGGRDWRRSAGPISKGRDRPGLQRAGQLRPGEAGPTE